MGEDGTACRHAFGPDLVAQARGTGGGFVALPLVDSYYKYELFSLTVHPLGRHRVTLHASHAWSSRKLVRRRLSLRRPAIPSLHTLLTSRCVSSTDFKLSSVQGACHRRSKNHHQRFMSSISRLRVVTDRRILIVNHSSWPWTPSWAL